MSNKRPSWHHALRTEIATLTIKPLLQEILREDGARSRSEFHDTFRERHNCAVSYSVFKEWLEITGIEEMFSDKRVRLEEVPTESTPTLPPEDPEKTEKLGHRVVQDENGQLYFIDAEGQPISIPEPDNPTKLDVPVEEAFDAGIEDPEHREPIVSGQEAADRARLRNRAPVATPPSLFGLVRDQDGNLRASITHSTPGAIL